MNIPQLSWQSAHDQQKVIELIKNTQVLLTTTDTVPGLLAGLSLTSHTRISRIKGQRGAKPYLVLIGSAQKASEFIDEGSISSSLQNLMNHCWPGPVTIICKARKNLASHVASESGTIALRCPDHEGLHTILQSIDGLFSTSANKSNQPTPLTIDVVHSSLKQEVTAIVTDNNTSQKSTSSTIIDCSNLPEITLVREGAYPVEKLEEYYGQTCIK